MLELGTQAARDAFLGLALAQIARYHLLAGPEDRATQACDPSAETGGYTVGRARSDPGFPFSLSRAALQATNALLPCLYSKVRSFRMSRKNEPNLP